MPSTVKNMHIRDYTSNDKDAVIGLLRLNTPQYFAPEEEQDLLHYLDHEIERYFVLEMNGALAGCGGINFSEDRTHGKISWDILHPQYQGLGLGSRLVRHRLEHLKTYQGLQTITVRTSQLAYKFYEKQGFVLTQVIEDYWAKGFHLYDMALR